MATIAETVSSATGSIFELVSGDTEEIRQAAKGISVDDWKNTQIVKAVSVGAASAAIPIAGYFTLPADLIATLRIMHRAATGVAEIELGYADDVTFAGILAVWSNAVTLDSDLANQIAAKTMLATASTVGGQTSIQLTIKAFGIVANAVAAKKLGSKVAQKVSVKIAKKLAAKGVSRWIPGVSALAGGSANWWIVSGICDSSMKYCDFIKRSS